MEEKKSDGDIAAPLYGLRPRMEEHDSSTKDLQLVEQLIVAL